MKDSKFIELLNLYLDHQISEADAALLEVEIQRSPERRRIYREYCQMQKACAMLSETFRTSAPAADGKVVAFPRSGRRYRVATYAMGVLAAAACMAVVMVNRARLTGPTQPAQVIAPAEVAVNQADALPTVTTPVRAAPARPALQPAFAGLVRSDRATTVPAFANSERVPFDWMQQVKLDRVPAEELWFQTQPTLQTEELTLRSRRNFQGQTEMTAFRFQR